MSTPVKTQALPTLPGISQEAADQIREQLQRKYPTYPYKGTEVTGVISREMRRPRQNDNLV